MGNGLSASPSGDFVNVRGRRLHYRLAGEGPTNVILLHGANLNMHDWTFQHFDHLAQSYRVIAFDRPGAGCSRASKTIHSLSEQAELMRDAAAALGITKAILVGHSIGAAVALAWALDAPSCVAGLVLVSGVIRPFVPESNWVYDVGTVPGLGRVMSQFVPLLASPKYVERIVQAMFTPSEPPEGYTEHVVTSKSISGSVFRNNAIQVRNLAIELDERKHQIPSLMQPIELICGAQDNISYPASQSVAFAIEIPAVNLTNVEGGGHMVHHQNPELVYEAIERIATHKKLS